jgi:hypothetical protein
MPLHSNSLSLGIAHPAPSDKAFSFYPNNLEPLFSATNSSPTTTFLHLEVSYPIVNHHAHKVSRIVSHLQSPPTPKECHDALMSIYAVRPLRLVLLEVLGLLQTPLCSESSLALPLVKHCVIVAIDTEAWSQNTDEMTDIEIVTFAEARIILDEILNQPIVSDHPTLAGAKRPIILMGIDLGHDTHLIVLEVKL